MRRILCVLLVVALVLIPALAETPTNYVVDVGYNPILISSEGEQLTEVGEYGSIHMISDVDCPADQKLYEVMLRETAIDEYGQLCPVYALMDMQGNHLTEFYCDGQPWLAHSSHANAIKFYKDFNNGVMDEQGNVVFEAKFDDIVPNQEDGFIATLINTKSVYKNIVYRISLMQMWLSGDDEARLELIKTRNEELRILRLYHLAADGTQTDTGLDVSYIDGGFSEGLIPVCMVNDLYGYVNGQGELAIDAEFEAAYSFQGDYAMVKVVDGYGMIRKDGSWAVEPIYDFIKAGWSSESDLIAGRGNVYDFLNRETLEVVHSFVFGKETCTYCDEILPGIFEIREWSVRVHINRDGEVLFDDGNYLSGDFRIIEGQPNRMALTKTKGAEAERYIIDLSLERIAGPYQLLRPVWWNGTEGRFLIAEYDLVEVQSADGEIKKVVREGSGRYGLVDQDGNEIFPAKFEDINYLSRGLYWVKIADTYGLIDEAGNWYLKISEYQELMD